MSVYWKTQAIFKRARDDAVNGEARQRIGPMATLRDATWTGNERLRAKDGPSRTV